MCFRHCVCLRHCEVRSYQPPAKQSRRVSSPGKMRLRHSTQEIASCLAMTNKQASLRAGLYQPTFVIARFAPISEPKQSPGMFRHSEMKSNRNSKSRGCFFTRKKILRRSTQEIAFPIKDRDRLCLAMTKVQCLAMTGRASYLAITQGTMTNNP